MLINGQKSFWTCNRRKAADGFLVSADACGRDHRKNRLRTHRRNNNNLLVVFGDGKVFSVACLLVVELLQGLVDQSLKFRRLVLLEQLVGSSALLPLQHRDLARVGDQKRQSSIHCWYLGNCLAQASYTNFCRSTERGHSHPLPVFRSLLCTSRHF